MAGRDVSAEFRRHKMFGKRLLSGIILILIAIVTVVQGGFLLLATVGIISIIGEFELYRTVKMEKSCLAVIGYAVTVVLYILLYIQVKDAMLIAIIGGMILLMAAYVITYPKYRFEQVAMIIAGSIYVSDMLSYVYQVRMTAIGMLAVGLIFIAAWGSDTCAYCTGMLIGKHKLPSELSPKKSIEGCIGGILGAAFIGFVYGTIFQNQVVGITRPDLAFALIGGIGSVISQIGDLAASAIKRNYEIKDYGNLIPGHGGILDRFDSIIFTAPIVYFLIMLL